MKKQSGFVLIEALIIILILLAATASFMNFYHHKNQTNATTVATKKQPVAPSTPAPSSSPTPTSPSTSIPHPSPVAKAAPTTPRPPSFAAPTPTPSAQLAQVTENYTILTDGQTAQESPVTTTLSTSGNINLIIKLTCKAACQFKLASSAYPLTDNTVYTTSQTISYTLSQHGTWYFYNEYSPGTKFGIQF